MDTHARCSLPDSMNHVGMSNNVGVRDVTRRLTGPSPNLSHHQGNGSSGTAPALWHCIGPPIPYPPSFYFPHPFPRAGSSQAKTLANPPLFC